MKLTKDESRILSAALETYKYEVVSDHRIPGLMDKLDELEKRLEDFGKDKRRAGRKSMNWFSDCLRRYSTKTVTNK